MEENISDVTAGASTAADVSSASAAADVGGQTGAITDTEGGQGESMPAPLTVAENETSVDAGAEEFQLPVTEEELQQAPEQWREKFSSLLKGYKSLETDHKALKAQYESLSNFGDAAQIAESLDLLNGLYGSATDDQGNILYDQTTGLPIPSTSQFIEKLQTGSPALVEQLFTDLWRTRRADGSTFAQEIFKRLGLDPARLDDYVALTRNPSTAISSGIVSPDELAVIPEEFHTDYKLLSPNERLRAQQMDDQELHQFLTEKRELRESRQFREDFKKQQEARQQAEMKQFWDNVDKSFEDYAAKLRRDAFDSIQKGLASQVQFSTDPTINAVQTGAVMGMLANLLDPNLRFAAEGALKALGVKLDQGFDDALNALSQQAYLVKRYEAIAQESARNPGLLAYRNDAAMAKAQAEVNRLYQMIQAKFNGIALKVAKALAGHNQELREVEKSKLEAGARPTVGNGALPASGAKTPPPGVKPFTTDWLRWRQQQAGG